LRGLRGSRGRAAYACYRYIYRTSFTSQPIQKVFGNEAIL